MTTTSVSRIDDVLTLSLLDIVIFSYCYRSYLSCCFNFNKHTYFWLIIKIIILCDYFKPKYNPGGVVGLVLGWTICAEVRGVRHVVEHDGI